MTADEARNFENVFGRLVGIDRKAGYPHILYGTIVKVDSYWLMFETTGEVLLLFSLRKATFTPLARKSKIYLTPKKFLHKFVVQKTYNHGNQ